MSTIDTTRPELRVVALSQIQLAEGFNPRGEVAEDAELHALAETIRARGCLMPVRLRAAETGGYVLIAGERRFRAAALAGLTEIPASIVAAGAGDEDEQRELLTDALIENELRKDLDPRQRALAFKAMLDSGLTVRGVAERLGGGTGRRSREDRIRAHLQILELPEKIARAVASGEVPLLAVKPLSELARIHPELADAAVLAVLRDDEENEPYSWQEVAREPLAVAVNASPELPLGLFNTGQAHPIDRFTLSEKAQRDLRSYEKLTGARISAVRFTPPALERARSLGAVHDCGWFAILAGQQVADTVAEDYIAEALKDARARKRCEGRERPGDRGAVLGRAADGEALSAEAQTADEGEDRERERQERERAEREAQRERREAAIRFNAELGLLAFKHLAKVKVDERVLRILASVDLGGCLRQIAMRGARLCLPGWVSEGTRSNGALKADYIEDSQVRTKAFEFLAGAESASDVAGRTLTLIALAMLADQEAIAASRRGWYELTFLGPWADEAAADVLAIVRDRIKEGQLPALDELLRRQSELAAAACGTSRS